MTSSRWQTALGFLLGIAGPILLPLLGDALVGPPEQRRVYVPQSFVETSDALDRFLADRGRVPTREEGLAALVPDFLPELPRDPGTREPFVYEPAGDGTSAELLAYGIDGKPGGEGPAADISLRALSMGPPPPPPDATAAWLVNASFLLTPLLALLAAYRWRWAAAALAGSACFAGVLVALTGFARVSTNAALLITLATGIASIVAGALVLLRTRAARPLAFVLVVLAWLQLALLAA